MNFKYIFIILLYGLNYKVLHANEKIIFINIHSSPFYLEIAKNLDEQRQGLAFRSELPEDGGMLFVFETLKKRKFHMQNCIIPLDLLFLDNEGRIIDLHEMKPETHSRSQLYCSSKPVPYAIELKGGTIKKLRLKKGQKILNLNTYNL